MDGPPNHMQPQATRGSHAAQRLNLESCILANDEELPPHSEVLPLYLPLVLLPSLTLSLSPSLLPSPPQRLVLTNAPRHQLTQHRR